MFQTERIEASLLLKRLNDDFLTRFFGKFCLQSGNLAPIPIGARWKIKSVMTKTCVITMLVIEQLHDSAAHQCWQINLPPLNSPCMSLHFVHDFAPRL